MYTQYIYTHTQFCVINLLCAGIKVTRQMFQCTCTSSGGGQAVKFNKLDAHHLNVLSALCMHDYIIYVGHI